MSRLIKFRGKNSEGKWLYGGISEDKKYILEDVFLREVDPNTVGQFTGAYDCDNKPIYEDDIVRYEGKNSIVLYTETSACFTRHLKLDSHKELMPVAFNEFELCKVIGNVHDNPGLVNAEGDPP